MESTGLAQSVGGLALHAPVTWAVCINASFGDFCRVSHFATEAEANAYELSVRACPALSVDVIHDVTFKVVPVITYSTDNAARDLAALVAKREEARKKFDDDFGYDEDAVDYDALPSAEDVQRRKDKEAADKHQHLNKMRFGTEKIPAPPVGAIVTVGEYESSGGYDEPLEESYPCECKVVSVDPLYSTAHKAGNEPPSVPTANVYILSLEVLGSQMEAINYERYVTGTRIRVIYNSRTPNKCVVADPEFDAWFNCAWETSTDVKFKYTPPATSPKRRLESADEEAPAATRPCRQ